MRENLFSGMTQRSLSCEIHQIKRDTMNFWINYEMIS